MIFSKFKPISKKRSCEGGKISKLGKYQNFPIQLDKEVEILEMGSNYQMSIQLDKEVEILEMGSNQKVPIQLDKDNAIEVQSRNGFQQHQAYQIQQSSTHQKYSKQALSQRSKLKIRYLYFLTKYKEQMQNTNPNQQMNWYGKMSQFIGNVSEEYCFNYHRYHLKQLNSIEGIINYFQRFVSYQPEKIFQQMKRVSKVINQEHNQKQKKFQQLFRCKQHSQNMKIIKFQSIKDEISCSVGIAQQYENGLFCEQQLLSNMIIKIPVEFLIIIKRKTQYRNSGGQQLEQKIKELIENFKNDNKIIIKSRCFNYQLRRKQMLMQDQQNQEVNSDFQNKQSEQICQQEIIVQQKMDEQKNEKFVSQQQKQNQLISWSQPQLIKLVIFLFIMKEQREKKNLQIIMNLSLKCSQYINSNKTPKHCYEIIQKLKRKYGEDFWNMLENQAKRLLISKTQIEIEKQKYYLEQQTPPQFQINLYCQKIQHIITNQSPQANVAKVLSEQLLNFYVLFDIKKFSQQVHKENEQKKSEKQGFGQFLNENKKIKRILHVQFSNQYFQIAKKTLKNLIYKSKNKLILIKKSEQIIYWK